MTPCLLRPAAAAAGYTAFPKCLLNRSSPNLAPSSLRTTDFAFDFESATKPLACRRFNESQSKLFQALLAPPSVNP